MQREVPQFDVAIENLLRLNLVTYPLARLGTANGVDVKFRIPSSDILCATHFGYAFVNACGHKKIMRNETYGVPQMSVSHVFWTRGGSLNISPAPPAKAIPLGQISPELKFKVELEALEIAKKIGCEKPGVALFGRILKVHLGKLKSCNSEADFIQTIFPLTEFCAERGLQLEINQML